MRRILIAAMTILPLVMQAGECKVSSIKDVDRLARRLKREILRSKSCYTVTGTTYYVSSRGDDSNDGKSPSSAFRSLDKVNSMAFEAGDAVLFRRGDLWRGHLKTCNDVSYSAYGRGRKPRLYGSPCDAAKSGAWMETDAPSVYVYSLSLPKDAGTLVFDGGRKGCAFKILKTTYPDGHTVHVDTGEPFEGYADIRRDLDFYHDRSTGLIYLRSDKGNPAKRFRSIEILDGQHGISAAQGVTVDNLCIKYVGTHGIGSGSNRSLTVTNCELGWIGGSIQFENPIREDRPVHPTRFGNAVEIWGGCKYYNVSHNYIYQVYDAGITHQFRGVADQENITYASNLVEKCVYAIEYFLSVSPSGERTMQMKNVLVKDNILRMSGDYGWGIQRPDRTTPALIKAWNNHYNRAEGFVIENNILDRGNPQLLDVHADEPGWFPVCRGNVFIQREGVPVGTPIEQDSEIIFINEYSK